MASQFAAEHSLPLHQPIVGGLTGGDAGAAWGRIGRVQPRRALGVWGHIMLRFPSSIWMLLDVIALMVGVRLAHTHVGTPEIVGYPHLELWQSLLILPFCLLASSLVFGLYERESLLSRSKALTRIMFATVLAILLTYMIVYVLMYSTLSRRVTAIAFGCSLVSGASIRVFTAWALQRVPRGLLIVGPGVLTEAFSRAADEGFLPHYKLIGFVDDAGDGFKSIAGIHRLGGTGDIPALSRRHRVHDIVVGQEAAMHPEVLNWLLPCLRMGCRITNEATFYEKSTGRILVDEITPHWFLFADLQAHCNEVATMKRAIDVVTSVIGLLVALPLLPLIALMIKLNDGGPVFYNQDRVGENGTVFRLYKFRTMRVDAENGKAVWAKKNDPRVTLAGRFLRKTRLDELPQLYNVLRGDMSLVGPRPERPDIVEELGRHIPYYAERHLVKPGISGWAQIGFRYGNSIEDAKRKLQFDLYYLKHMSFELDAIILFRTLGVFLRGAV